MSARITRDPDIRESVAEDASGLHLVPEAVARPASEAEAVEVLREAVSAGMPVTTAGGQTSTTGASITDRGLLLSLRALDRIVDVDPVGMSIRAQAGVPVAELARVAAEHALLFAPDPTSEVESTIGGAVACNASGARTLRYGPTRRHVLGLKVALASGEVVELRRPRLEKNTVGYALAHDPVDWFVGSEGTLGVVLEAELALLPRPARVVGFALPFPTEAAALGFVAAAREATKVNPRCLEYFDERAAAIFQELAAETAPPLVYAEATVGPGEEPPFDAWLELAEAHGVHDADIAVYDDDAALREARRRRHAVPATMNERGARQRAAGGRKVSTDWAVPYRRLADAIAAARRIADEHGIEPPVIYGHAGNGHPHQNFIARDAAELERIERAVEATLRHVVALGGTVAAEHGIGKLKRRWLPLQMSPLQIAMMRAVKRELDPNGLLAPGNVL
ncbi:MAG: FAD-binding oxidoreductase [Gemmatimonadetes bacterium]|nr:FAD-binding oxidoreductase [Gemmatimonadota bacterium]